jgi:MFS family permease
VTAGAMIVAFHSLAFFVETPLLAWSERVRARWFSAASLAVIALSSFAAAIFQSRWSLLLALAVYGPASGCALAVAEGLLVEAAPHSRERTMARLSFAANAGDLAVPLLLAVLSGYGLGWRAGFVVAGALASLLAIAHGSERSLARLSSAASGDAEGHFPTIRETLRTAFSIRPLLGWSFGSASTNLLDEVLVAFSAVHLHALGATIGQRSGAVAAWILGGFVGLAGLERLGGRASGRRVLLCASAVTATAVAVLAATHSTGMGTCALFVIGATGGTLHPLAKARAYGTLPNRPALVNAVGAALLPFEMAAPMAIGIVASRAGSLWAIVCLLVAPAVVAIAAWCLDNAPQVER